MNRGVSREACMVVVCTLLICAHASPKIGLVTATSASSSQVYRKFEVAFNITPSSGTYSNPYDPSVINVYLLLYFHYVWYMFLELTKSVVFKSPSSEETTITCFMYVPYVRSGAMGSEKVTANGSAYWLCRYFVIVSFFLLNYFLLCKVYTNTGRLLVIYNHCNREQ